MDIKLAIANVVDSRSDFFNTRKSLAESELESIGWLRNEFKNIESRTIHSCEETSDFAQAIKSFGAQSLIVHIPIWADPIFTVKLANYLPLPILLLGNNLPETSSMVGLLGAGGALDQIGRAHLRIFNHREGQAHTTVRAFVHAAAALDQLHGQTLGLFGGRSLGIFTAMADPAQWQKLFGVDIETIDQAEIIQAAEALSDATVAPRVEWLLSRLGSVQFGGAFTRQAFERQVRSSIATRNLIEKYNLDFVGVKCQPELSDGYVSQCVAHMLLNSGLDVDGAKKIVVHACESDADGALTMQIMHLLSGGQPAALLDIRWYNENGGIWTLANCGALPASFCSTAQDPSGLSGFHLQPHAFGLGGGGALAGQVSPQKVTLARLCRKDGEYWMAIMPGSVEKANGHDIQRVTPAFPKAFVRSPANQDFLKKYGSNHIHMVSGDYTEELVIFCQMAGIRWELWK